jgi:hypothetical protein
MKDLTTGPGSYILLYRRHSSAQEIFYCTVEILLLRIAGSDPNMDEHEAERLVQELLEELRSDLSVKAGKHLEVTHPRGCTLVEVKMLATLRIPALLGLISQGVLQVRKAAEESGAAAAVIVVTSRIGARAIAEVEQLIAEYAPDVGYGLVDLRGKARLHIPSLDLDVDRQASPARSPTSDRRNVKLFTDLNRWLLKVLLLLKTSVRLWGGPRGEEIKNPTQLAGVARVSVEKAHRFFRTFEGHDFLRQTREHGLRPVRVPALLDTWMAELRSVIKPERYGSYAIGGFEVCRIHNLKHTGSMKSEVYVQDDFDTVMEAWDLIECGEDESHLLLTRSRCPESIFRGRVVNDGFNLVDLLQAALDVSPHPAGGREQAEFLINYLGLKE